MDLTYLRGKRERIFGQGIVMIPQSAHCTVQNRRYRLLGDTHHEYMRRNFLCENGPRRLIDPHVRETLVSSLHNLPRYSTDGAPPPPKKKEWEDYTSHPPPLL